MNVPDKQNTLLKKLLGIVIVFLFLFSNACFAQRERIDSLKKVLHLLRNSVRVDCLNALSDAYLKSNSPLLPTSSHNKIGDTAADYANLAYNEALKLNYIHGIAEALSYKGEIEELSNNFPAEEKLSREAINWYRNTTNKKRLPETYASLGYSLFVQGLFKEALKNFDSARAWDKKNGNTSGRYLAFSTAIYVESGNYEKAFEFARKGIDIAIQNNNDYSRRWQLLHFGSLFRGVEDYKAALEYYRQAFQNLTPKAIFSDFDISQSLAFTELFSLQHQFDSAKYYYGFADTSNSRTLRFYLTSTGEYFFLQKQYHKALLNFLRGLQYHQQFNDRNQVMRALLDIAKTYLVLTNDDSAFKYGNEGLSIATQTEAKQVIRDAYEILSSVYEHWHQPDSAYFYYKQYTTMKDSVQNNQVKGKLAAYTFDQKMELLNKEKQIQQVQFQKQSLLKNIFIGSIVILLILGVIIFRNIILKRKNERLRLEHEIEIQKLESEKTRIESRQALLYERLRISRELHDDIGSTLGSISIYSEVAKKRTEKNENTGEVLSKIGLASRELIDKMSDIVWSLNPDNESFEQLQNRMMAFAAMILAPRNILYDFIADEKLKKLQFTGAQCKNIFLIFKEALYNIVKYADCKTARIRLSVQNNHLMMIIQDDGKGFDVSQTTTNEILAAGKYLGGNGIKNMNARADDMTAKLCISSKINAGTTVQLVLLL